VVVFQGFFACIMQICAHGSEIFSKKGKKIKSTKTEEENTK
jgi:hypothetical protein